MSWIRTKAFCSALSHTRSTGPFKAGRDLPSGGRGHDRTLPRSILLDNAQEVPQVSLDSAQEVKSGNASLFTAQLCNAAMAASMLAIDGSGLMEPASVDPGPPVEECPKASIPPNCAVAPLGCLRERLAVECVRKGRGGGEVRREALEFLEASRCQGDGRSGRRCGRR